jgi:hypothetical protein
MQKFPEGSSDKAKFSALERIKNAGRKLANTDTGLTEDDLNDPVSLPNEILAGRGLVSALDATTELAPEPTKIDYNDLGHTPDLLKDKSIGFDPTMMQGALHVGSKV